MAPLGTSDQVTVDKCRSIHSPSSGPSRHEEYEETLEWVGGWIDPEEFDQAIATKRM